MSQAALKFYTTAEYLKLEAQASFKSEYYRGQIFMMAGGSGRHNLIALNLASELRTAFRGKACTAFMSDVKVAVEQNQFYTYPDIIAVCGEVEYLDKREDTMTNPTVIVEVLSKSTQHYDRTTKFELYRALPSFQHYVLIDQKRVYIETYERQSDQSWLLRTCNSLTDTLKLEAIDFETSVANIYDKVRFPVRERKLKLLKHPQIYN